VILPAFKAGDPALRGSGGGFDSHTLPPKFHHSGEMNGMHYLYALLCIFVGGGITWMGHRLKAPYERAPGATGFAGPIISRHLLIGGAGDLLVTVGLVMAVVFSLTFILA
jgi:hypothetical protein